MCSSINQPHDKKPHCVPTFGRPYPNFAGQAEERLIVTIEADSVTTPARE
jgi:hypothetical protein